MLIKVPHPLWGEIHSLPLHFFFCCLLKILIFVFLALWPRQKGYTSKINFTISSLFFWSREILRIEHFYTRGWTWLFEYHLLSLQGHDCYVTICLGSRSLRFSRYFWGPLAHQYCFLTRKTLILWRGTLPCITKVFFTLKTNL